MNFINRANSSKLVLPGMVCSIFIIIVIGMKKTHTLLCIDKFLIGSFFLNGKLTGTKYVDSLSTCLHTKY